MNFAQPNGSVDSNELPTQTAQEVLAGLRSDASEFLLLEAIEEYIHLPDVNTFLTRFLDLLNHIESLKKSHPSELTKHEQGFGLRQVYIDAENALKSLTASLRTIRDNSNATEIEFKSDWEYSYQVERIRSLVETLKAFIQFCNDNNLTDHNISEADLDLLRHYAECITLERFLRVDSPKLQRYSYIVRALKAER